MVGLEHGGRPYSGDPDKMHPQVNLSAIYQVKGPLITVCQFRVPEPVCRDGMASPFNIGYIWDARDSGENPSESWMVAVVLGPMKARLCPLFALA